MTFSESNIANQPVLFETIQTACGRLFGRATLNSPASLNALTLPMVDLLDKQLDVWAKDPSVVGVLLDAAGDKAFCAGGDVVSVHHAIRQTNKGEVPQLARDFFTREYRLDYRIHTYQKPIICWGHGIVMGGGVGLMAGASHRVVTPKTRMAMPEITIGLYPDVGGSWILSRLPGKIGSFLAVTGAIINAGDVLFAGLADFALEHEHHAQLIDAIKSASWHGVQANDSQQVTQLLNKFSKGVQVPKSQLLTHFERINQVIGNDGVYGMSSRLTEMSQDEDPWLAQAAQTFVKGSPTSAVLGLEMQKRVRILSLADTFKLELQASLGCCVHPDFYEGVRALLVDKDKNPKWQPANISEVTSEWIESHLEPRFENEHPLEDLRACI